MKHETRFKDISHPREILRIRTWQCTCRLSFSLSCTKTPIFIGIYNYRRFNNAVQLILASLSSYSHTIRHSGEVSLQGYVVWPTAHCWHCARDQNDGSAQGPTSTLNTGVLAHNYVEFSNVIRTSSMDLDICEASTLHASVRSDIHSYYQA